MNLTITFKIIDGTTVRLLVLSCKKKLLITSRKSNKHASKMCVIFESETNYRIACHQIISICRNLLESDLEIKKVGGC